MWIFYKDNINYEYLNNYLFNSHFLTERYLKNNNIA